MSDKEMKKGKNIWLCITRIALLLFFGACIIVPIIIHKYNEQYNTAWCVCTIVFLLIPFGAAGLKMILDDSIKSGEQRNKISAFIKKVVIYFWFMDFVALCICQNWLIMTFIFGAVAIIIIFYNISFIFTNLKRTKIHNIGLIMDLSLGVGLTIYLIYIIPNDDLRNVVIPIIAAVYGGMITLAGVVLTIQNNESNRKEDEIKKSKPLVFIVNSENEQVDHFLKFIVHDLDCSKVFKGKNKYIINDFLLKNADYSFSCLKGICINNDIMVLEIAKAFDKNQAYACICDFEFSYNKEIKSVYLLLQDMLDNYYTLEVNFEIFSQNRNEPKKINIRSGIELKKVNIDFDQLTFTII